MAGSWKEFIPVVTVTAGMGGGDAETFTGYGASVDNSGALLIYEMEQGFEAEQVVRKKRGHCVVLANGTWERAESVWEPVGVELN